VYRVYDGREVYDVYEISDVIKLDKNPFKQGYHVDNGLALRHDAQIHSSDPGR